MILLDVVAATDAGFEVVEKKDVPHPESEEVKAAVSAQGEDGELLVNYVQVAKDEVPAVVPEASNGAPATNEAAAPEANGVEAAADGAKGGMFPLVDKSIVIVYA